MSSSSPAISDASEHLVTERSSMRMLSRRSGIMLSICAHVATPIAAFVTFMVQPVVGKHLLPWHGGSASTWVTSMVFFQGALLGGYLIAHWLQSVCLRRQALSLAVLAIIASIATRLPPMRFDALGGAAAVLLSLCSSLLPAMLLTTAIGIAIHGWLKRVGRPIPYYLYSISNVGSVLALLAYPFWIEPRLGLASQAFLIYVLLSALTVLVLVMAVILYNQGSDSSPSATTSNENENADAERRTFVSWEDRLYWFLLAAGSCIMMISVTRFLAAEIGSNPVSWVLPLTVYLLSFSITFSGLWREWNNEICAVLLSAVLIVFISLKGLALVWLTVSGMGVALAVLACGALVAHGLIYLSRPRERFSVLYLSIAAGGTAGGIFASMIAPRIFPQDYEFFAAAILVMCAGIARMLGGEVTLRPYRLAAMCLIAAFPPVFMLVGHIRHHGNDDKQTLFLRNIYGQFSIEISPDIITASSEATLHGGQLRHLSRRDEPITYFHPASGIGRVIEHLKAELPSLDMGVVGLGVGTLAAYGREQDSIVFWEINPAAKLIADWPFSYLGGSKGTVDVRFQDGRLGIRESNETFDLLVIDAFSGDAIPLHLITREAIGEYLEKIPNGVLIVQITNRYIDLFPVLSAHAQFFGIDGVKIETFPTSELMSDGVHYSAYFIFSQPTSSLNNTMIRTIMHSIGPHMTYSIQDALTIGPDGLTHWTDDRHAFADLL